MLMNMLTIIMGGVFVVIVLFVLYAIVSLRLGGWYVSDVIAMFKKILHTPVEDYAEDRYLELKEFFDKIYVE